MPTAVDGPILVREWSPEVFHGRVLEMEALGYVTRLETYSVKPEVDPETGWITHLYSIEMVRPAPNPA